VKEAYRANRIARGFPVREDALDAIFTPTVFGALALLPLALDILLLVLLFKNRKYFAWTPDSLNRLRAQQAGEDERRTRGGEARQP
jgi:hypothetical protein